MLKPSSLKPGDTIGIVSPSWGGAGAFPHRVEQGIKHLEALDYKVRLASHALNQNGFVSDTPANRAQDIHDLFADPSINAIIAAIGGDHSCHLLPHLDFDLIASHPKIFMGYSDFFFETSEDKPSPATVDGILMDHENMGVFEKLRGMIVGRPMSYSDAEKQSLRERILERTQGYSFPIITDMDFGHTAPQFTLPLGCRARIESAQKRFEIIEAAVM